MKNNINIYDLARDLAELCDEERGTFSAELQYGDVYVLVRGEYSKEEYQEDDYYIGTGNWVTSDARVNIEELVFCDEDGEDIDLNISLFDLEILVENELIG